MQRFLAFSERKKVKINCTKFCLDIFFLAKINFKPSQRDKHLLLKFGHCLLITATEMQGKVQSYDIIYRLVYNHYPVSLIRK